MIENAPSFIGCWEPKHSQVSVWWDPFLPHHLCWIEGSVCQRPPDFLFLHQQRPALARGAVLGVLLLGPGNGERKSASILANYNRPSKTNQATFHSCFFLFRYWAGEMNNFQKNWGTFRPQTIFAGSIFLTQMNQDISVAWLLCLL